MKSENDVTVALDALAPQAVEEVKKFFQSSDDNGKKADAALKLLGRKNGNDSNRIKFMALQFQVARAMGLKGEPLRPLLAELNPVYASGQVNPENPAALAASENAAQESFCERD